MAEYAKRPEVTVSTMVSQQSQKNSDILNDALVQSVATSTSLYEADVQHRTQRPSIVPFVAKMPRIRMAMHYRIARMCMVIRFWFDDLGSHTVLTPPSPIIFHSPTLKFAAGSGKSP